MFDKLGIFVGCVLLMVALLITSMAMSETKRRNKLVYVACAGRLIGQVKKADITEVSNGLKIKHPTFGYMRFINVPCVVLEDWALSKPLEEVSNE